MSSEPPFGIPGECAELLEPVQNELWQFLTKHGGDVDAGCAWLDEAAGAGRVARVVADHVRAWNDAKRDAPTAYLLRYAEYAADHSGDWARDGLEVPDEAGVQSESDVPGLPPMRRHEQARNERCACGSRQKYKFCHGR